ncbi:hypothetical protein HNQ82_001451 [Anoxybacillus tengchongensis]|uniref:Uncharacterized protein n=1 Tax=Anoxybacillus tengchongensis TaxID=576944 RepID=A0A7W9YT15_9BACL|nr:hypothetical protein [Anoxybacillus tengchongensis]MBB6176636.1 hypothetical protein [Anoxybacillus tengchongensis]
MFHHFFNAKRKIVIELNERYFDKNSLMRAVVQHLESEGKQCEMIDVNTLILDGKKYYVHETNVAATYCPPVQRAVLTEIN